MKYLHAADIHIDSPLRGLSRHEDAPVDVMRGATRRAFETLVELAIEEEVAFVLLAGDLLDGNWKDFSTGIFLAKQLGRLGQHGIEVYAVLGNHDAESKITKELERPANLHLFGSRKASTEIIEEHGVAIHGQSYGAKGATNNLAAGYPQRIAGKHNIGLLHTSLNGREGHATYAPCSLDELKAKGYDYWALGHIHQHEVVSEDPWVVFPGCTQGRHARELGPKGCCLVSVEDEEVRGVDWRALDVLRWTRCEVDLSGAEEMQNVLVRVREAFESALGEADGRPVAARVVLGGSTSVHRELEGKVHWLRQQCLQVAAEVGGDDLWVEKLVIDTTAGAQPAAGAEHPLAGLIDQVRKIPEVVDAVPGLEGTLKTFMGKVPAEVFAGEEGLDLEDPELLARLVREAKGLLVNRLLGDEGEG